ncbi:MAG: COG1361 S-layer family protein [Salinigranum sp.]
MKRILLALIVLVALLSFPLPAAAAGPPGVTVFTPDKTLTPGTTNKLTLTVANEGQGAYSSTRTAQSVSVELHSTDSNLHVKTGTQYVGPLKQGQAQQIPFAVTVPETIDAGSYDLTATIHYTDQGTEKNTEETVTVKIESQPRFEVVDSTSNVPVGGKGTVSVTMKNVGDETASESVVALKSTSSDVAFGKAQSATQFVGTWKKGETRTLTYDVTVGPDAGTREYTVDATVNYQDSDGIQGKSRQLTFGLEPLPEQTFAVKNVSSALNVGQRGTLSGTITNTGTLTAHNAVVVFKSNNPTIRATTPEYAVGTLRPNESTDFTFDVAVNASANAGPRQFSVLVQYRNANDDQLQSSPIDVRTRVKPQRPEFDLRDLKSSLRVGEQGTINGTVVNTGTTRVRNAVLLIKSNSQTLTPVETEYALGDLKPGGSTHFSFDADVSSSADAGPRQLTFLVQYRNTDNVQQRSSSIDVRTDVAKKSPEFDVQRLNSTVQAGGTNELRLKVTNTRQQTLTDISAKLYTEDPISSSDDQAYVSKLAPGESATIVFSVSASGSALEKTYPVKMDFQYDDAKGQTTISDTYQVPVSVTSSGKGGGVLPIVAVAALVVLGGGLYVYRRR